MRKDRQAKRKKLKIIIVVALALLVVGSLGYIIYRVTQNAEGEQPSEPEPVDHAKASAEFDEVSMRALILNEAIDEKKNQVESFLSTKPDVGKELTLLKDLENSCAALADMKITIPTKPQETKLVVTKAEEIKQCIKESDASILDQTMQVLEEKGYMPKEGSALYDIFSAIDKQLELARKAVDAEKKRIEEEKEREAAEALEREKNAAIQSVYARLVGGAFTLGDHSPTEIEFVSDTNVMIYSFWGGRLNIVDATYHVYTVSGSAASGYDFVINISEGAYAFGGKETWDWQPFSGDMSLKMYTDGSSGTLEFLDIGSFRFMPTDKLWLKAPD